MEDPDSGSGIPDFLDSNNDEIEKNFKCETCNKEFSSGFVLKKHIEGVHEGIRYKCQLCEISCSQLGALNEHIKSVHQGIRYDCEICQKSFKQRKSLKKHQSQGTF